MTVALSAGPDRAILTAVGAIASLTTADVPAALLTRARHVHVSSYFLLERSLGPGLAAVLSRARAAGAVTSLDTNWDPAQRWGDSRLRAAFGEADLLLPNEAEALHLSGEPTLAGAIQALNGSGSRLAVKLDPRGALSVDGPRRHRVQLPEVKAVPTLRPRAHWPARRPSARPGRAFRRRGGLHDTGRGDVGRDG
jgi:sugar/nucleoside kinase (ribokinase family)